MVVDCDRRVDIAFLLLLLRNQATKEKETHSGYEEEPDIEVLAQDEEIIEVIKRTPSPIIKEETPLPEFEIQKSPSKRFISKEVDPTGKNYTFDKGSGKFIPIQNPNYKEENIEAETLDNLVNQIKQEAPLIIAKRISRNNTLNINLS